MSSIWVDGYEIPFDQRGNLVPAPSSHTYKIDWRPNHEYDTILRIKPFFHGHSIEVEEEGNRRKFRMFLIDLLDVIRIVGIEPGGVARGRWTFVKRGNNYGIKLTDKQ